MLNIHDWSNAVFINIMSVAPMPLILNIVFNARAQTYRRLQALLAWSPIPSRLALQ